MCFTPAISLSTAIIEWALAVVLLVFFRKSRLTPLFSIVLFLLGAYQFTEFMLCTTGSLLWVRLGFVAYTFLPALGLHAVLSYLNRKKSLCVLYAIPLIYAAVALFSSGFALEGTCTRFFVMAKTLITDQPALWFPYALYYGGFIALSLLLAFDAFVKAKDQLERRVYASVAFAILLMALPTFVLIFIFPSLGVMFPSVLCHFALLLAICIFIAAYQDAKLVSSGKTAQKKLKK